LGLKLDSCAITDFTRLGLKPYFEAYFFMSPSYAPLPLEPRDAAREEDEERELLLTLELFADREAPERELLLTLELRPALEAELLAA